MNYKKIAEQIFLAGVDSVLPDRLISKTMVLKDNWLGIGTENYDLNKFENIYIIGAGKASALMGAEVEKILSSKVTCGLIVVKYGYSCKLNHIEVVEAGHPVPDSNGFKATQRIVKIAENAGIQDLVICLISGGGSALLSDYPDGSSPEELMYVNSLLINCGADISEINCVRKHLSAVKGGQLARAVNPAILVSLILSDVPGDNLDVIASGPTVPDPTTWRMALEVLNKYNLEGSVPAGIMNYLKEGEQGRIPETPKPGDAIFSNSSTRLIGTNRLALEAAAEKASEFNFRAIVINEQIQGDTKSAAEYIIKTSLKFQGDINEKKPLCLLLGGETTVNMIGKGAGGRNQHLALISAVMLQKVPGITILSAGTDGTDGPTDAAGAVIDSETVAKARDKGIEAEGYLAEFDSYNYFKRAGGHIITGPTSTNVMDIIVVIVE